MKNSRLMLSPIPTMTALMTKAGSDALGEARQNFRTFQSPGKERLFVVREETVTRRATDMTAPTHTVRNSLIDKERTFTLSADSLSWRDVGGDGKIPYGDVREMRLIGYTSPIGEALQCTVRAKGREVAKLRSAHYRSLGNFEDRTDTYAPFVSALSKRIAAHAPSARFIAGSNVLWTVWLVLGLLCAIVVALLVLSLFEGVPPAASAVVAIVICIAGVPIAIRRMRGDRANDFDPAEPPMELLGREAVPD